MARLKDRLDNDNVGVVSIQRRMIVAFVFIIIFFIILTFRIGWIQIVAKEVYATRAAENQIKDERIEPQRGSILDRNMRELAVSTPSYRIWLRLVPYGNNPNEKNPEKLEKQKKKFEDEKAKCVSLLALTLEIPEEEILPMLETESSRVRIAKDVPKSVMEDIVAGINLEALGLIEIEDTTSRKYPLSTLGSKVIGSVNNDGKGQSGVEKSYNDYLSGIVGRKIASIDMRGNELTGTDKEVHDSTDGVNVVLTIDETIQYYVEEAIAKGKEETLSERMLCIVMDPNNGDILAMADTDPYDPNVPNKPMTEEAQEEYDSLETDADRSAFLNKMWKNPLISDVYDPGSVFKLVTVSSALEECKITPDNYFYCGGSVHLYDREIKCWNYPGAHGSQSLKQAVQNSCNPAMIQIIQKMGNERFYDYLELFGMTEKTGIDLPDETSSLVQSEEDAGPIGLATMAFGQGISITPIQLASAVAAIANDGKLMRPRVVKGIANNQGEMIEEFPSKIERQIMSTTTAQEVRDIMEFVAQDRSLDVAHINGYRIGVKTGTTQKLVNGAYDNSTIIGSMVTIAPIEDPKFIVLVISDTPRAGRYGNSTAGPTLKNITTELLRYLNVKPNFTEAELNAMEKAKVKVPDLVGDMYSDASGNLESRGLHPSAQGNEKEKDYEIVAQYPAAGTLVEPGSTIFLYRN